MQPTLDAATHSAAWFEEILKYDSAVAVCVALAASWFAASALAFFVRGTRWSTFKRIAAVRIVDMLVAGIICGLMWPHPHKVIWGFFIGVASPWLYKFFAGIATKMFPSLAPMLSLKELLADPPDAASDETGDDVYTGKEK